MRPHGGGTSPEGELASRVEPLEPASVSVIFLACACLLFCGTRAVTTMAAYTGSEPVPMWFVAASVFLLVPLLGIGLLMLLREGGSLRRRSLIGRLRLRSMSLQDWLWSMGALAVIALTTGSGVLVLRWFSLQDGLHPTFMAFDPPRAERSVILAAWLPFFALNILGEELVWRGVILPRQEVASGGKAWLYHGLGW